MAHLDGLMKQEMLEHQSKITRACLARVAKPFPANNMALMTVSGAKGPSPAGLCCCLGV